LTLELEKYSAVDEQLKRVVAMKEFDRKASLMEQMSEKGEELLVSLSKLNKQEETLPAIDHAEALLIKLDSMSFHLKSMEEGAERRSLLLERWQSLNSRRNEIACVERQADAGTRLTEKIDTLLETETALERVLDLNRRREDRERLLFNLDGMLIGLKSKWRDLFPDECPLCGQEVKK